MGPDVPAKEKPDIIAYLSEVAELVGVLSSVNASINQQSLWAVLTSIASCHPDTLLYAPFYSLFMCWVDVFY